MLLTVNVPPARSSTPSFPLRAFSMSRPAASARPRDRKRVRVADDGDDEVRLETDRDPDVDLLEDRDPVLAEARVHQREGAQRFDDRADEEGQQREPHAVIAQESSLFLFAPRPQRADVDFDHRPGVRGGALRFDHPLRDDLARLRERDRLAGDRRAVARLRGGASGGRRVAAGAAGRGRGSQRRRRRLRGRQDVVRGDPAAVARYRGAPPRSIACSRARRRTAGETRRSSSGAFFEWPLPEGSGAPLAIAVTVAGSVAGGSACGADARRSAPTSSMIAIGVPVGTVSPSLTINSRIVPLTGAGTSAFTLSVETSTNASYFSTVSPTFLSHCATVPSVTDSPSCGIVIVVGIIPSFPLRDAARTRSARASPAPCARSRS